MTDPVEPRYPTLTALALLAVWVAVLSWPMLQGQWLAHPFGDQYAVGFGFRAWGSEQWRALGHVPLWNPMSFGGLPFVAAGHGDIFYPTSFLRLILPVGTTMNLGFVLHYIAAGFLTYLFLRRLRVSWGGAVVGGLAYQLTGLMLSYAAPGHDGKLFASTALPLACLGLQLALRERRLTGYPVLAVAVALALLGHVQMAYYLLIAAGLYALYLTFGEPGDEPLARRALRLSGTLAAVIVGFGVSMIQIWPFLEFIPYGPRSGEYGRGYVDAITWGVPWDHVPGFFLAGFVGDSIDGTYWGSNFAKLHSEYLSLPVVALAVLGAADRGRRRLAWWLGGIGLLFLLVSLTGATPFYRLWYAVMPMVKKTRAAGMAFFIPSFVVAVFAGVGAARLERGEGHRAPRVWLVAGAAVALLALAGVAGGLANAIAAGLEPLRQGTQEIARESLARAAAEPIRWGAFLSGVALAAVGGLVLMLRRGPRVPALALPLGLAVIIGADLWRDGRRFWHFSPPPGEVHAPDPITRHVTQTAPPYRAFDAGVYPGDGVPLTAHGIPLLLGHSGNELHRFDELMGGRGVWQNLNGRTFELFAVGFVITPAGMDSLPLPGFRRVLTGVTTSTGGLANLFERENPVRYARVIPAALKTDDERVVPTLMQPRLPLDRIVLLGADAGVEPPPLTAVPEPSPSQATVTAWRPGEMSIALEPAPPAPSYVLVSENWFPEWEATVDGQPAQILRGNHTMLTVPVPAGARAVELAFRSPTYRTGKRLTLFSLAIVAAGFVVPAAAARRRRSA